LLIFDLFLAVATELSYLLLTRQKRTPPTIKSRSFAVACTPEVSRVRLAMFLEIQSVRVKAILVDA